MIVRRLSAIVIAASLLHLNMVRADVACAVRAHDVEKAPAEMVDHSAHHAGHAEETGSDRAALEGDSHPATTDEARCCQAMVSCAPMFDTDVAFVSTVGPAHEVASVVPIREPSSRVSAPEPPPPKA